MRLPTYRALRCILGRLRGNSHQILLSEMSLPGIEALIEKSLPKILGRLGKEFEPLKKTTQSCLCTAQVRCDVVSFSTISVRYVQLVKQKLAYACRLAVSVVRYVYAFRNYLSECLRSPVCHQVLCDVT